MLIRDIVRIVCCGNLKISVKRLRGYVVGSVRYLKKKKNYSSHLKEFNDLSKFEIL